MPQHFCHWAVSCAHTTKKTCGYQCHALPVHPPLQIYSTSSRIHIWNPVGGLQWSFFAKTVNVGCFSRGASSLMFDWILNVTLPGELFTTGFTQGNLELFLPPNSLDSHQIKNNMVKISTDPRSWFPEEELIHWVDKTKNVWLIVGQLPIKPGWWVAPLVLRHFSRINMNDHSTRI